MNDQLEDYARETLKEDLALCTDAQLLMFNRMYSHKNLDASIDEVVSNMDADKLDRAMQQVQRTLQQQQPKL